VSPLATVIIAWAAVYAYVCAYFCTLYGRRRTERTYLSFGLLAGSLSIYAIGAALLVDARVVEESALGTTLKLIGVSLGAAFSLDFCHAMAGKPRGIALRATYVWAVAGIAIAVAGIGFHPAISAPRPTWGFERAPDFAEPALTVVGQVHLMIACIVVGYGLLVLAPLARKDGDVRLILLSLIANLAAGGHDIFVHVASLRSVYLTEHSGMLSIVAMSYLLLDRYVRTGEQLTMRTRELRSSYDELRHTQEELVRKEQLAAVGELAAVIAHEVRNPLAVIKNSVSGLRRSRVAREDRETLLGILDEEVDRLNRLVTDLLAYARPLSPQRTEVSLPDLVDRTLHAATTTRHPDVPVRFDVSLEGTPEVIHGDPDLLRNAFANIVDNAIQAMPTGGTLRIRTGITAIDERTTVRVDFIDTGEGMEASVQKKARDPFFTTRPSGTGLGLAIVERVVRTHGGRVEIESAPGDGTKVSVFLPVRGPVTRSTPAAVRKAVLA
jgi:signal transduction histidine kinase